MFTKGARLNYTALWLGAAITGLAENWLLRSFGLNTTQRMIVGLGFVPLLVFLALTCAFQRWRYRGNDSTSSEPFRSCHEHQPGSFPRHTMPSVGVRMRVWLRFLSVPSMLHLLVFFGFLFVDRRRT